MKTRKSGLKRKSKIKKNYIVFIGVAAVLLIISVFMLQRNIGNERFAPNISAVMSDLSEYNNQLYMNTLTKQERDNLSTELDNLFHQNCEVHGGCSIAFLSVYIDIKRNLGIPLNEILQGREDVFMSAYSQIPYKLTENELKGFEIPFLIKICKSDIINQTEKISWGKRVVNIERSNLSSYKQILYSIECLDADSISDLSKTTGTDLDNLNTKLCNNIVTSILYVNDVCNFFVNLKMKKFCGIEITSNEQISADMILSQKYEKFYHKNCQDKLSKDYNDFFQS